MKHLNAFFCHVLFITYKLSSYEFLIYEFVTSIFPLTMTCAEQRPDSIKAAYANTQSSGSVPSSTPGWSPPSYESNSTFSSVCAWPTLCFPTSVAWNYSQSPALTYVSTYTLSTVSWSRWRPPACNGQFFSISNTWYFTFFSCWVFEFKLLSLY